MLVGSVLIGVFGKRLVAARTISSGILLLGATLLLSGLLPSSWFPAFAVVCLGMGLSVPLFSAPATALYQTLIDPALLGRVTSLVATMTLAATPVGLLAAGPLAERLGLPLWFSISGILILAVGVFCLWSPAIRSLTPATIPVESETLEAAPAKE